VLPKTRWVMLIGCLALAGCPPFAGFWSKDEIVGAAFHHSVILGVLMLVAAFMTAYYTFRLYFRVFEGPLVVPPAPADGGHGTVSHGHDVDEHLKPDSSHSAHAQEEEHGHNHEPALMIWPLVILAIGAALAGFLNWPERANSLGTFLGASPSFRMGSDLAKATFAASRGVDFVQPGGWGQEVAGAAGTAIVSGEAGGEKTYVLMVLSAVIALAGIGLAYLLHLRDRRKAEQLAASAAGIVEVLDHKYWVDEIYQALIVEPLKALGRGFYWTDRVIVDGIVWLFGFVPQLSGFVLKLTTQRGYLQGYATTMLLGVVIILLILFL